MYFAYLKEHNVVQLGPEVVCDGAPSEWGGFGVRVQTHIHQDHMTDWEWSMHNDIYMTQATKKIGAG